MSQARSNIWKSLPTAVVAVVALSTSTAFTFEVHESDVDQLVAGSSAGVAGESGALFAVGAGLAILAASLRRLTHRYGLEHPAPAMTAPSQSRP